MQLGDLGQVGIKNYPQLDLTLQDWFASKQVDLDTLANLDLGKKYLKGVEVRALGVACQLIKWCGNWGSTGIFPLNANSMTS